MVNMLSLHANDPNGNSDDVEFGYALLISTKETKTRVYYFLSKWFRWIVHLSISAVSTIQP